MFSFFNLSFQVLFVHIDMADEESERVTSFFNIEEDDAPTARIINLEEDMKKFIPDFEGLDGDKIKAWIKSYLDGELKVKSVFILMKSPEMAGCIRYMM